MEVSMENLIKTPIELADAFDVFMDLVDIFRKAENPEELFANEANKPENWNEAFTYYNATRGANTDLPQRTERLEALKTVLL